MKISTLIKNLQQLKNEHGDLKITISQEESEINLFGVSLSVNSKDEVEHIILCDKETFLAFVD